MNSNRLINESSTYLQQHAHNPVNWYPWGQEALSLAIKEEKPILVSIGYSSCHWCHVMERESFENNDIADYLNSHFVSIKVDREERPDIDQIYMDAVQAMGINGGWPLNVFLTPEQKPFYGGTYFPPQSFTQVLHKIISAYKDQKEELNLSAERLTNHIAKSEVIKYGLESEYNDISSEQLEESMRMLQGKFDKNFGGMDKAPKFPMPSLWMFFLRYGYLMEEKDLSRHIIFTLKQIASGGIYDQIGGGFSRYSVDEKWLVPHFEKMLYDNGQLLSLFAEAYTFSKEPQFSRVINETIEFLKRDLKSETGGFYAALDADSEGIEGKYYTWTYEEFKGQLDQNTDFWLEYFGIRKEGNWEMGFNIPVTTKTTEDLSLEFNVSLEDQEGLIKNIKEKLRFYRDKRVKPGLDNKILGGWNAMIVSGILDAYDALGDRTHLDLALETANYLIEHHLDSGKVYRTPFNGPNAIPGYLEDYGFVIEAFLKLYQATFNEKWLERVKSLLDYTIENFFDKKEDLFYFTDKNSPQLIAAKKEILDNVIPSSNAVMASNLYIAGLLFDNDLYQDISEKMLRKVGNLLVTEPEYMSKWGILHMMISKPTAEVAIVGRASMSMRDNFMKSYYPNKIVCGTMDTSDLPLLAGKVSKDNTTLYVCYNKTCKLPVQSVEEAYRLLI